MAAWLSFERADSILLLSSSGLTGRSSTPRPFDSISGVSGILGRPVKPGDDDRECGVRHREALAGWNQRVGAKRRPMTGSEQSGIAASTRRPRISLLSIRATGRAGPTPAEIPPASAPRVLRQKPK